MRHLLYLITFILFAIACKENISEPEEQDPLRYKFPNYNDAHMRYHHSFFHDCGDGDYWTGLYRSKDFFVFDLLFLLISEEVGLMGEVPNLTAKEKATLICSNGDHETIIFDLPYSKCIHHIDGVLLLFGGFPSSKQDVVRNNGFIDIQQDTVQVIAEYKSYWTGNIVTDTAYVFP